MATEIDVEDENILTAIFKDSFPDSWQDNPDFVQYLVELSSHGAERLAGEPDRLQEEKAQILSETQDLAFHNYSTFIQTADCSKEIFKDFQIIEQHLDSLVNKLPTFSEECNKVILKAQEISSSRRMNSLTLQRHTQLLEVLEMPQLMDTCVRNGYYEEALELAAHVRRLEKKHPNIPVIMGIVSEVKSSTQLMLNQLIQQLRTDLQLPACLRVIGFLRRMDVFTEAELRIKFLQARDSWFQGILDAIPTGDAYTHISKTVEASRVHLFDIMTQFRAIFSDEDPLVSTARGEDSVNEALLFHSWVMQKISQFLATLEHDLSAEVGGRLDSILGQCMYFGLSFSRVGADFRGLLAPIFERAALQYFEAALVEANKKFEENMQSYNLLGLTTTGGLPFGVSASQSGQLYPPTSLLDFYPLAAFCNHCLTAFNDLRLCAPLNLAALVSSALQRSLREVNRVILAFYRAEESTFNAAEKQQFEHFCATYATDLLPYLSRCLQALFPPHQLAKALGLTVSQIHAMKGLGQLDIPDLLSSVCHLMPAAVGSPVSEEADVSSAAFLPHDGLSGEQQGSLSEPATVKGTVGDAAATTTSAAAVTATSSSEVAAGSGQVTFTLDSDGEETRESSTEPNPASAAEQATTSADHETTTTTTGDSGIVGSSDGGGVGDLTDSGIGSSTTAPTTAAAAESSLSNTEVDVSEGGGNAGGGGGARDDDDTSEQQQQQEKGDCTNMPSTTATVDTEQRIESALDSGSDDVGVSDGAGDGDVSAGGGGWEEGGLDDLVDLDAIAVDGGESPVDLDLLPTPSGSEIDLDKKLDKKD